MRLLLALYKELVLTDQMMELLEAVKKTIQATG